MMERVGVRFDEIRVSGLFFHLIRKENRFLCRKIVACMMKDFGVILTKIDWIRFIFEFEIFQFCFWRGKMW